MADFAILKEVRLRTFAALVPPPQVALSAWIEANICLPEGLCAVPGPMRLYAYQREIADAIGNPDIERVTLQKAARIGFSVLVAAAIGPYCENDPSPILCLLHVESDCRDFMTSDIEPLFAASPALQGVLRDERATWAQHDSVAAISGRLAQDRGREIAAQLETPYFADIVHRRSDGMEGDPIDLAMKRTLFPDRKIIVGSTPLEEETSHVCLAYAASDQRVFECPCPACGAFAELPWAAIEWQSGDPETAAYRCAACRNR